MGADLVATNRQLSILPTADAGASAADPAAEYGEVFTRRWVVEFILDMVGYVPTSDLASMTIVEPSCGTSAFLVPIVERLIDSCDRNGRDIVDAARAVVAFDLLPANAALANKAVVALLIEHGVDQVAAEQLAHGWVGVGDFLLTDHPTAVADFVVGNPPYIRLEDVPTGLTDAYRRACPTMRGRSDIYVGFFETGLDLLKPGGVLGFICADRWMHNQYGAALRELITSSCSVDAVIAMHDVPAFEDEVSAYPAITILRSGEQRSAHVVQAAKEFDATCAAEITRWVKSTSRRRPTSTAYDACKVDTWFSGRDLWPSGSPSQLALLADLECRFAPLEDERTGTRVGIGVATGCDEVYITRDPTLVEEDRLLPLLLAGDLTDGGPAWSGRYLVNPWDGSGLVDLAKYPKLRRHFEAHGDRFGTPPGSEATAGTAQSTPSIPPCAIGRSSCFPTSRLQRTPCSILAASTRTTTCTTWCPTLGTSRCSAGFSCPI
ncbi:MAG: class I SAM-dependent DNA methyltransferase [Acidimicrobiales bacterium]